MAKEVASREEKVRLLKRLIEIYPESQERRALALAVSQATVSRWEAEMEGEGEPKISPHGMRQLRRAVEQGEAGHSDYIRGQRAALLAMQKALDRLRATLPPESSEAVEIGERGRDAVNQATAAVNKPAGKRKRAGGRGGQQ